MGWQIRKPSQFFSHEVSNSMVVFWRIRLRVSSLWAFLFWRHTAFLSFTEVFCRNSIYKKATSLISFMGKSSRSSGCVCHISCFLVNFEGSLQALKLGLWYAFCFVLLLNVTYFCFSLSLFVYLMTTCFQTLNINGRTSIKKYLNIG